MILIKVYDASNLRTGRKMLLTTIAAFVLILPNPAYPAKPVDVESGTSCTISTVPESVTISAGQSVD